MYDARDQTGVMCIQNENFNLCSITQDYSLIFMFMEIFRLISQSKCEGNEKNEIKFNK